MIPKFRAFDKINKVMLYEIDNLGECRVSIDEMVGSILKKNKYRKIFIETVLSASTK
jgi:hypothetical protein